MIFTLKLGFRLNNAFDKPTISGYGISKAETQYSVNGIKETLLGALRAVTSRNQKGKTSEKKTVKSESPAPAWQVNILLKNYLHEVCYSQDKIKLKFIYHSDQKEAKTGGQWQKTPILEKSGAKNKVFEGKEDNLKVLKGMEGGVRPEREELENKEALNYGCDLIEGNDVENKESQKEFDHKTNFNSKNGFTDSKDRENSPARGVRVFQNTERAGFEPAVHFCTHAFQACTFDHSDISPLC